MIPSIRAQLVERFIFNFRVPLDDTERLFPPWLAPQPIDGAAVGSFCILDLDKVTFDPVPDKLGLRNINCAMRFGAVDRETGEPSVYVVERNTNSRLGSFITSLGFPGEHTLVNAAISREQPGWNVTINEGKKEVFSAKVTEAAGLESSLFDSVDSFKSFLASGVRSYCPAKKHGKYNVVDLHKDDSVFQPLQVSELCHDLIPWLPTEGTLFDSALRTSGGQYLWEYIGQRGDDDR